MKKAEKKVVKTIEKSQNTNKTGLLLVNSGIKAGMKLPIQARPV